LAVTWPNVALFAVRVCVAKFCANPATVTFVAGELAVGARPRLLVEGGFEKRLELRSQPLVLRRTFPSLYVRSGTHSES
jgi:hypothetical protein